MRSLRDLLPRSGGEGKQEPLSRVPDEKTVFFLFNRVIEEEYGKRGRTIILPSKYAGKALTVRVASPLWANELMIHRAKLAERINAAFGESIIEEIRVTHGLFAD